MLVGVVAPLEDEEALLELGPIELIPRRTLRRAPRDSQLLEVLRLRGAEEPLDGLPRRGRAW